MAFLIDTNLVSELRKRHNANPSVLAWQKHVRAIDQWISVISLMEIRIGVLKAETSDAAFAQKLDLWYHRRLLPAYRGRILPVDLKVAEMRSTLSPHRTLPHSDALIAATAKHHRLTIATRNTKDFEGLGIDLINPWEFGSV
ncbi:MAG: PIN domain-containing protein [Verrucomicrobia bacterium]|jgi:predicted nucleic acid-binding protein|nr:PIN domain-containing protein [Verrucomicrobiota bacterium]